MTGGVPYALAFAAGNLAAFNPCGFAMLPAYLTLFVAEQDRHDVPGTRRPAVARALVATAAMTGGFAAVFGVFALVVSPLALSVERWLPWVTVVIGLVLVALGGRLLSGRELRAPVPKPRATAHPASSARSMSLYGVSYAVASLSCTVGPFLALITTAFHAGSVLAVVGVFAAYALGMGSVVGVLTLAVALSRQALVARIRRVLPHVTRAGGALLLLAGAYVAYYGWYEIRVLGGGAADDPVVRTATVWQGAVTRELDRLSPAVLLATVGVLTALGVVMRAMARRRTRQRGGGAPEDGDAVRPGPDPSPAP